MKLAGETPISDCLAENQPARRPGDRGRSDGRDGDQAQRRGAGRARRPGRLQLGYLLGAAERGAERTEGIHADLVRRLAVAARYAPGPHPPSPSPPFLTRAYRQGYDAGHARG